VSNPVGKSLATFGALASFVALVACPGTAPPPATPKKCPPQTVTLSLLASASINPTSNGSPRPVVVRVYQLKNDERLYNAAFEQVWHDDKTSLGDDVVKVDEVEIYPGTRADVKFERSEAVQHVAAVALFQDPKGRSWFSIFDLPPPPEDGKCDKQACTPDDDDDDCLTRASDTGHYSFWLDGSKVDDGVEHIDDFQKVGPMTKKKGA
jgi:type VI secretion system protein VasD